MDDTDYKTMKTLNFKRVKHTEIHKIKFEDTLTHLTKIVESFEKL